MKIRVEKQILFGSCDAAGIELPAIP